MRDWSLSSYLGDSSACFWFVSKFIMMRCLVLAGGKQ